MVTQGYFLIMPDHKHTCLTNAHAKPRRLRTVISFTFIENAYVCVCIDIKPLTAHF